MSRTWLLIPLLLVALAPASLAAGAAQPTVNDFTTWATAGSRLGFVAGAVGGRHGYLWVERFGSTQPRLLRTRAPIGQGEIDELAVGPNGTWGCLERDVGNTESYYSVDLLSSRGGGTQVATAGGPTVDGNPPVSSIPELVGDGTFLGYLYVTPAGLVQLFRITPSGHGKHTANLAGVSAPQEVSIADGHLAVRQENGDVAVFTTGGVPLTTIAAHAASVALTADRVVVRTTDRRLLVYGLHGGLVHNWPIAATAWTAGLAAYGRYAVYLGANKAVHAVRLSTGADRIVARAGIGWFFGGLSLQAPGVIVPLTTQQGKSFSTTLRFLPITELQAALG